MRLFRDLRSKLVFSHLTVIVVTLTVISFLLLSLGNHYFLNALEKSLFAQGRLIARTLIPESDTIAEPEPMSPAMNTVQQQSQNFSFQVERNEKPGLYDFSTSNLSSLSELTLNMSTALVSHIRILDTSGIVLIDTQDQETGRDLSQNEAVSMALAGEQQEETIKLDGEEWLFISLPISVEGNQAGVIQVGQPLRDIQFVLADLRWRLLFSALIGMLLAAIVGLMLASRLTHPLKKLTAAARKLSDGDYDSPLVATNDEIGELTTSFTSMRSQLKKEELIREQFVSNVSHELRTPLTAIKGFAETLQDGAVEDEAVRDRFLSSIERETDRLIRLTKYLLILSRADAGAISLQLKELDLLKFAASVVATFSQQARSAGVALEVEEAVLPHVRLDPDRMEQVLVNLIDNAVKHTPAGGKVSIAASLQPAADIPGLTPGQSLPGGNWLVLEVTDTGRGIPQKDLAHIFDRFYRTDSSRSRQSGGSGLGLSIARSLIESHGGVIRIQSPAVSSPNPALPGTTAFIALPPSLFCRPALNLP